MIKKLLGWNKYYATDVNIFLAVYRIFSFVVPVGIFAYCTFLHKLFSGNYTVNNKICSSVLVGIVLTALFVWVMVGKHYKKKIETIDGNIKELTTKTLTSKEEEKNKCVEDLKSENLTLKKTRRNQALYKNINLLVPFIIVLVMVIMIEKAMLSMRGVLFLIVASMLIGFVFNLMAQIKIARK